MQTASEMDEWIRREWLDVTPGEEAVDMRDLAPEKTNNADPQTL